MIKIENLIKPENRRKTFWNFRRANWSKYAGITDVELAKIDTDTQPIETSFEEICSSMLIAAKTTVPQENF